MWPEFVPGFVFLLGSTLQRYSCSMARGFCGKHSSRRKGSQISGKPLVLNNSREKESMEGKKNGFSTYNKLDTGQGPGICHLI